MKSAYFPRRHWHNHLPQGIRGGAVARRGREGKGEDRGTQGGAGGNEGIKIGFKILWMPIFHRGDHEQKLRQVLSWSLMTVLYRHHSGFMRFCVRLMMCQNKMIYRQISILPLPPLPKLFSRINNTIKKRSGKINKCSSHIIRFHSIVSTLFFFLF